MGDKCKLMRPKAPRVGDKGETTVNSCGSKEPRVGDKCGRQVWETSVGDKGKTNVNPCGPRNPEWETSVGDRCGRQVWETSGRQVGQMKGKGETSEGNHATNRPQSGRQVGDK